MSSRSQDAATLAELAKQVHSLAAGNVKLVTIIDDISSSLDDLTCQVNELEEEVDRLSLNRG
jgi:hypothetical protein